MDDFSTDFSENQPQYRVSVWEVIAITGGAVLLVAAGLLGLGMKAMGNAFDPQRAEAIAHSLMKYEIPGGSRGFLGTNIGGGKMAVVASTVPAVPNQSTPAVELFLARIPVSDSAKSGEATDAPLQPQNELFSGFSFSYQDPAAFQIQTARVEQKPFCGAVVPVEVQVGSLTTASTPLPAVKYQIMRILENDNQIVVISALGDQAASQADQVFNSLRCEG
ncbi:MAG: hypothetical protein ACKO7W_06845 [Elainella sp.]